MTMVMLMARCPNGHIFPASNQPTPGADNVYWEGNSEACRYCGAVAKIDDFFGNVPVEVVQIVRSMSWADAQRLRIVVEEAQKKPETQADNDVVGAIAAVSPELGAVVRRFRGDRKLQYAVLGIAAFVLSRCTVNVKVDINVNDLFDHLNRPQAAASQSVDDAQKHEAQRYPKPPGRAARKR